MTDDPSAATRFRKGVSGNPKGRPKKQRVAAPPVFATLFAQTVDLSLGGEQKSVSVEEAVQQRLFHDGMAGKRTAQKEVVRMILARNKARGEQPQPAPKVSMGFASDPRNAEDALLLLGIAVNNPKNPVPAERRLLLEPWAVQAALSRPGRRLLTQADVASVERCTLSPQTLRWPKGLKR